MWVVVAAFTGIYVAITSRHEKEIAKELKLKREEVLKKQKLIEHLLHQEDESNESRKNCEKTLASSIMMMKQLSEKKN